jgi:hypothetical protein
MNGAIRLRSRPRIHPRIRPLRKTGPNNRQSASQPICARLNSAAWARIPRQAPKRAISSGKHQVAPCQLRQYDHIKEWHGTFS